MTRYNSIMIPGGGLLADGSLPPWTQARLDAALELEQETRWICLLSGGTVHKPHPLDSNGYPLFESRVAGEYLISNGVERGKILTEICSYDTIGNAYFSRLLFAEPLEFQSILVITSEFHLPRTRQIFNWIYQLEPKKNKTDLYYQSSPDLGLDPSSLKARVAKEEKSLNNLKKTQKQITSMGEFHRWLYTEHQAYLPGSSPEPISPDVLKSY